MKKDLPDWALRNEELENRLISEQAPMPAIRQTAPPSHLRKIHRRRTNVLPLAVAVAVLAVITTVLTLVLRRDAEPESLPELSPEEEPVTLLFGDRVRTAITGIPLNPYGKNTFGVEEKG